MEVRKMGKETNNLDADANADALLTLNRYHNMK